MDSLNNQETENSKMENYINEPIDVTALPRFEDVELKPLHPSYLKVIWLNFALVFGIITIGSGFAFYFINELHEYWLPITGGYIFIVVFSISIALIKFRNRGFAFRTHDAIYRSGAISITTTIIPYNRVQHVALHEGFISRMFNLAKIEIFTAGGDKSDIQIPGIEKQEAEKIKLLLMGKILTEEENGE
jgi:membrane protein YdbS with pleckstrin-like domain